MPTTGVDSGKLVRSASAVVSSTESGQHLLKIDGYYRIKDAVSTGNSTWSPVFRVGGNGWYVCYFANGSSGYNSDCISVRVVSDAAVRAQFTLSLLDQSGEPVPSYTYHYGVQYFNSHNYYGPERFIQKNVLERSEYLKNDSFAVRFDVTVIKSPQAKHVDAGGLIAAPPSPVVSVPPSDLARHLAGLLATGQDADVAFDVDGKAFMAHRCVLAARSPVFYADLFGPATTENAAAATAAGGDPVNVVRIDDMEAQDFEALLHFIYTDALPDMKGGDAVAMLPDLAAAANRYKMERLRLACEEKLCEYANVRTVAVMLAFAGEHHCDGLKKKCLQLLDDPANLRAIVETEGLEHLTKSYPSVLKDLIAKLAMKL